MAALKKTITVGVYGGTGNQMFQYALGRKIALATGGTLRLDIVRTFEDPARPFALGGFRIDAVVKAGVGRFAPALWSRLAPLRAALRPGWVRYVRESGFAYDPSVAEVGVSAYLDGYWQSEKYFTDVAAQIRDDFRLAAPMSDGRRAIAGEIAAANAVSVHVRRGDYVSNPVTNAFHGTCAPEWYAQAMAQMAATVENPTFFVFSDDPDWARENLPDRYPRRFVEPQADGRDFEDMHLMAVCRHHVIANSSFSWWGAWLNPAQDKKVIAPARWFAGADCDTRDLLPSSWKRL